MEVVTEVQSDTGASEATHESTRRPPLMQVMKYMVPSLLALATLEYQGKGKSSFVENPIPVWCFLAATCVYWLIVGVIMEQMPPTITTERYKMILSRGALASGALSAKSLLLIFIPPPLSFWLLAIWIPLLLFLLAWSLIKSAYNNSTLVGAGILTNAIDNICTKVGWVRGYEGEESLPV